MSFFLMRLQIAQYGEAAQLSRLFTASHGLELGPVAEALGVSHRTVNRNELRSTRVASISPVFYEFSLKRFLNNCFASLRIGDHSS